MFTVNLNNKTYQLNDKTPILSLIPEEDRKKYLAAKVNNRLRELNYELCFDCTVELLDKTNSDAIKVYETTLRFLIAMAFNNIYPEYKIRISYNISRSLLVSIIEPKHLNATSDIIRNVEKEIKRLVAEDIPFTRAVMSKEDAKAYFISHNDLDKADILRYRPTKVCHFNECAGYLNYMYGYLTPSTGYIDDFRMFGYDKQIVVQYPRYENGGTIPEFVDAPTFSKVLKQSHSWAKICSAELIAKMNDHISNETDVDFINMCETKHNDMLAELGDIISKDIDTIKLICIAGPSSSGKTTFSNRLRIELMSRGITPLRISLDMYYKKRELCPKDENGEYDFEDIEALDL